jgi:adenine-specific DNA-methyltransferase
LDCKNTEGIWHSDREIKIDKLGYVIEDGKKTKTFWDAKISFNKKPLRMKVRNIEGDEIEIPLSENKKTVTVKEKPKTKKK